MVLYKLGKQVYFWVKYKYESVWRVIADVVQQERVIFQAENGVETRVQGVALCEAGRGTIIYKLEWGDFPV